RTLIFSLFPYTTLFRSNAQFFGRANSVQQCPAGKRPHFVRRKLRMKPPRQRSHCRWPPPQQPPPKTAPRIGVKLQKLSAPQKCPDRKSTRLNSSHSQIS